MYSIKYKHKDATTEYYLYRAGDQDYCLTSGKLSVEMGKAGELNISLPITNPAIEKIECLTDEIIVYRDDVEIWRGRPITSQQDFELTGTLICEGVLAYLYDTIYPPFEFQGKPADLLKAVINNHNGFVNNDKKFTIGNITVVDKNDYINRSSTDYLRSIEILSDKFVGSSLGGYFRVRIEGGVKYLDYLDDYDSKASQNIEFGENILDLATEIEYGDAITAILPLGAKNEETGEKVTVKSVNSGDLYVRDTGLISERGFIAEVVEWEDVTEPSNLLTKARTYLSQASTFIQTFTIKAIDLHYADATIKAFNIGDSVKVISEAHGVNQYSELYKADFDLLDPSNDSYEFGITRTSTSLTGKTASSQRNIKDSLSNLTVNFHKIAADYASIEYLSANYATIQNLEAEHAHIVDLQADYAQIGEALIDKANIADLTAAKAQITELEADYANIATLLAGTAGVGDLQTIHLTSQNSVIDVAMIRNLLAQNITVNDLLAGDIITNKQRIISNDGSFVIDGSTQVIKDANGNVRIQIGQDATGDFTFSLFDETGTGVLIDATGIKEDAIADGLIKNSMVADNANISATKLDIASLFTAMNADGSNTLYANKIWFDDRQQSLTQVYSQMSSSITQVSTDLSDVDSKADSAYSMAEAATRAADQATRALGGITSLDNLTAILSNDAHVVHTNYDGTGGVYTYAKTQVYAYKGDTDVTARAAISVRDVSAGVAGTWDVNNKVYQVTEMTALNGYVDFEIAYGENTGYLLLFDNTILMPDGKRLKINTGAAKVYKRFSISKSPDGMAGTTWNLYASVGVIRRSQDGLTLSPSTITFSAKKVVGEIISTYSGRYKIEETTNLTDWVQRYYSSAVEETKTYTPSVSAKMIRCTLMDEDGDFLDSQTVTVIADADELNNAVIQAQQAIQSVSTRVGTVETGINGLRVDLGQMETQIHGMAAGNLLFQTPYTLNSAQTIYTFNAKVYKEGVDEHTSYPKSWFQWFRRSESGTVKLGTGYSITVNKNTLGYGSTIIGRFSTFEDASRIVMPDDKYIVMPDDKRMTVYTTPVMQFDVETNVYDDDAIVNKFSAIATQFDVTLGKISAIISDSEITNYNTYSTMASHLSTLQLSLDGLYGQWSETIMDSENGLVSKVSTLEDNYDGLTSKVVYTNNYTGEVIASLINQSASTVTINASHINLTAKNVADIVNGGSSKIQEAKISLSAGNIANIVNTGSSTINESKVGLTGANLVNKINGSSAVISANHIELTASGIASTLNSGSSTINEAKIALTGANVVDKINSSTATISANRIALTASGITNIINNGSSAISEAKITLTGANLVSKINSSSATISADRINLSGYVTITNLKTAGKTTINGSNITTGTIDANLITSGKIQSKNGRVYFDLDNNVLACSQLQNVDAFDYINNHKVENMIISIENIYESGLAKPSAVFKYSGNTDNYITIMPVSTYLSGSVRNGSRITAPTVLQVGMKSGKSGFSSAWFEARAYKSGIWAQQNTTSSTIYLVGIQANGDDKEVQVSGSLRASPIYGNEIDLDTGNSGIGKITCKYLTITKGTKNRLVDTNNYAKRLLYCYETSSPMFGDVGEGVIGEDGKCYVWLDPIFSETINTDQYQVLLQKYGDGDCYVSERKSNYFVVYGTSGMSFGWELKSKQADHDQLRLENDNMFFVEGNEIDYSKEAEYYIQRLKEGRIPA